MQMTDLQNKNVNWPPAHRLKVDNLASSLCEQQLTRNLRGE